MEVTESKLPVVDISKCLSISESSKHSTTLIAIYETFIHVLFKAENNKKILVWVLKRGSLSIITVNNNLVLHKRHQINTLKKQIHENEW